MGVAVDTVTSTIYVTNQGGRNVSVLGVPVAITIPAAGASVTSQTPAISGTGMPGAAVTVTDASGTTIGTATVAADGTWTITPATPLPLGRTTVTATQLINGITTTATVTFTITG